MLPAALRRSALPLAATLVAATLPLLTGGSAVAGPATPPAAVPATVAAASPADGAARLLAEPLASFRLRRDGAREVTVVPRRYVAARIDLADARAAVAGAPTLAEAGRWRRSGAHLAAGARRHRSSSSPSPRTP